MHKQNKPLLPEALSKLAIPQQHQNTPPSVDTPNQPEKMSTLAKLWQRYKDANAFIADSMAVWPLIGATCNWDLIHYWVPQMWMAA